MDIPQKFITRIDELRRRTYSALEDVQTCTSPKIKDIYLENMDSYTYGGKEYKRYFYDRQVYSVNDIPYRYLNDIGVYGETWVSEKQYYIGDSVIYNEKSYTALSDSKDLNWDDNHWVENTKTTFAGRMELLVSSGRVWPFLLFVGNAVVRWSDITIYHDYQYSYITIDNFSERGDRNAILFYIPLVSTQYRYGEDNDILVGTSIQGFYFGTDGKLLMNDKIDTSDIYVRFEITDTEHIYFEQYAANPYFYIMDLTTRTPAGATMSEWMFTTFYTEWMQASGRKLLCWKSDVEEQYYNLGDFAKCNSDYYWCNSPGYYGPVVTTDNKWSKADFWIKGATYVPGEGVLHIEGTTSVLYKCITANTDTEWVAEHWQQVTSWTDMDIVKISAANDSTAFIVGSFAKYFGDYYQCIVAGSYKAVNTTAFEKVEYWEADTTYEVGDGVLRPVLGGDDILFKCNTENTDTEWTPAHWDQVTVYTNFDTKLNTLSNLLNPGSYTVDGSNRVLYGNQYTVYGEPAPTPIVIDHVIYDDFKFSIPSFTTPGIDNVVTFDIYGLIMNEKNPGLSDPTKYNPDETIYTIENRYNGVDGRYRICYNRNVMYAYILYNMDTESEARYMVEKSSSISRTGLFELISGLRTQTTDWKGYYHRFFNKFDFAYSEGLEPVWAANKSYKVNDCVYYDGNLYKCCVANTDTAWNSNHWDLMISKWVQYTYLVDEYAIYNESLYKCTESNRDVDFNIYHWESEAPVWVSGTTYAVGDKVLKDYQVYTCNTANTDASWTASHWTGTVVNWVSGTTYAVDDRVSFSNALYKCIVANTDTTWTPSHWEVYAYTWKNAEMYEVEERVIYNNERYKCLVKNSDCTWNTNHWSKPDLGEENVLEAIKYITQYDYALWKDSLLDGCNVKSFTYTGAQFRALADPDDSTIHLSRYHSDYLQDVVMVFVNSKVYYYSPNITYTNNKINIPVVGIEVTDHVEVVMFYKCNNGVLDISVPSATTDVYIHPAYNLEDCYIMCETAEDPSYTVQTSAEHRRQYICVVSSYTKDDNNNYRITFERDYYGKELKIVPKNQFRYYRHKALAGDETPRYKVRLPLAFNYCHDIERYMIFINGRKVDKDQFTITIMNEDRPFDELWLYLTTLLDDNDYVDIFYVPEIIHEDYSIDELTTNGWLYLTEPNKYPKTYPLSKDTVFVYLNGLKVNPMDIKDGDMNMLAINTGLNEKYDVTIGEFISGNEVLPQFLSYDDETPHYPHPEYEDTSVYDEWKDLISDIMIDKSMTTINTLFGITGTITDPEEEFAANFTDLKAILYDVVIDYYIRRQQGSTGEKFVYDFERQEWSPDGNYDTDQEEVILAASNDPSVIKLITLFPDKDKFFDYSVSDNYADPSDVVGGLYFVSADTDQADNTAQVTLNSTT